MGQFATRVICGLDDLAHDAEKWDRLWDRCDAPQPTVLFEPLRAWCESFASSSDFRAVVLEHQDEFVAALPVIINRHFGIRCVATLPANCWSNSADLMLDTDFEAESLCQLLIEGLRSLDVPFLLFDEISIDSARWTAFINVLTDRKIACRKSTGHAVAVADILHDFNGYRQSWSSNHRHSVQKHKTRLEAEGTLEVERVRNWTPDLANLLVSCFEVEDRGWKGDAGSSVLKIPGMLEFMQQEAEALARKGLLDLWMLRLDKRLIAFEYCHNAKGTCFSHKISFDPQYKKFSPGNVLRYLQLEAYHQDPEMCLFDMLGLVCSNKAKWATRTYSAGRLLVANGSLISPVVLQAYTQLKRWRTSNDDPAELPKLGAERYLQRSGKPSQEDRTREAGSVLGACVTACLTDEVTTQV